MKSLLAVAVLVLGSILAGCLEAPGPLTLPGPTEGDTQVVDEAGRPVPLASVTARDGAGSVLLTLGTTVDGVLARSRLPATTTHVVVAAPGFAANEVPAADLGATLALDRLTAALNVDDPAPVLQFLPSVLLGGTALVDPATCAAYNCGGSEPSVEVAGDGTVYATGVCCVGAPPPVWVSRDRGATFEELRGDLFRESFGIEGDLAVDDAGNVYFFDISVASIYFASWDKDGRHRWTVPFYPVELIVDRPWVRAGAENQVFIAYNTGSSTMFYDSADGGKTWTLRKEFGQGLGNLGQGPERDHLWVIAGGKLYESRDAGKTWSAGENVPRPSTGGGRYGPMQNVVVDETGHLYAVYDWRLTTPAASLSLICRDEVSNDEDNVPYHVYVARRDPDGEWTKPIRVSPDAGTHFFPWAAAGKDGRFAVAWYGTLDSTRGPDTVATDARWSLFSAVSVDATAAEPHFQVTLADPDPVLTGPYCRRLLDFLQVDIGPDGGVHVAYAERRTDADRDLTRFVRSTVGLDLAPGAYPNGPKP